MKTVGTAVAAILLALASQAAAQDAYPNKTINIKSFGKITDRPNAQMDGGNRPIGVGIDLGRGRCQRIITAARGHLMKPGAAKRRRFRKHHPHQTAAWRCQRQHWPNEKIVCCKRDFISTITIHNVSAKRDRGEGDLGRWVGMGK